MFRDPETSRNRPLPPERDGLAARSHGGVPGWDRECPDGCAPRDLEERSEAHLGSPGLGDPALDPDVVAEGLGLDPLEPGRVPHELEPPTTGGGASVVAPLDHGGEVDVDRVDRRFLKKRPQDCPAPFDEQVGMATASELVEQLANRDSSAPWEAQDLRAEAREPLARGGGARGRSPRSRAEPVGPIEPTGRNGAWRPGNPARSGSEPGHLAGGR